MGTRLNLSEVPISHVFDILVHGLESVESELGFLRLFGQVHNLNFFDPQLILRFNRLSVGLGGSSCHFILNRGEESFLDLEFAFLFSHLADLSLIRLDFTLLALSFHLSLVTSKTSLNQLAYIDVLLVQQLLLFLLKLFCDGIQLKCFLIDSMQPVVDVTYLFFQVVCLSFELFVLLKGVIVLLPQTVLEFQVITPSLLKTLDFGIQVHIVLLEVQLVICKLIPLEFQFTEFFLNS